MGKRLSKLGRALTSARGWVRNRMGWARKGVVWVRRRVQPVRISFWLSDSFDPVVGFHRSISLCVRCTICTISKSVGELRFGKMLLIFFHVYWDLGLNNHRFGFDNIAKSPYTVKHNIQKKNALIIRVENHSMLLQRHFPIK